MHVSTVERKASTVVHILLTFDLINDLLGGSIAVLAEANVGCLPKLASALYNVFEWSSYVHIYALAGELAAQCILEHTFSNYKCHIIMYAQCGGTCLMHV